MSFLYLPFHDLRTFLHFLYPSRPAHRYFLVDANFLANGASPITSVEVGHKKLQ